MLFQHSVEGSCVIYICLVMVKERCCCIGLLIFIIVVIFLPIKMWPFSIKLPLSVIISFLVTNFFVVSSYWIITLSSKVEAFTSLNCVSLLTLLNLGNRRCSHKHFVDVCAFVDLQQRSIITCCICCFYIIDCHCYPNIVILQYL